MRMAYLILAHDNPAQLDMLIERLVPPGSSDVAIVHIDARAPLWKIWSGRPETHRLRIVQDPVAVRWGHFSQVSAILRVVDLALEEGCDFAHLISGVDWPVATRARILREIESHETPRCYLEAKPAELEHRMQTYRLDSRWLRVDPQHDRIAYAANWELRRLSRGLDKLRSVAGRERSRPFGTWHKGSTWWSLPREALQCIADEISPLIDSGRLAGTQCADEHAIQTLIAARFSSRLSDNRRFIVFPEDSSSPDVLRRGHLPAIADSNAWFARKLVTAADDFFLDLPAKTEDAVGPAHASPALP